MVTSPGLEPGTYALGGHCAIQLCHEVSWRDIAKVYAYCKVFYGAQVT